MNIAIAGCTGRMGQALLRAAAGARLRVAAVSFSASTPQEVAARALAQAGLDAAGTHFVQDAEALAAAADAIIDFTSPESTLALAQACAAAGKVHVIGTTGLTPAQQAQVAAAAKGARIVQSANFSLGVNVLSALVERAAALLGEEYDIEVDEMHHRLKKDSPSGTALLLAASAAKGRGAALEDLRRHWGEGMTGERERGAIGISARRGGEVVGVHTVTLAGPGETLELTHRAQSRDIYAHGAIKAAQWAAGQQPGLYSMRDVLGL